jgi:hypothetical protein
MKTAIFGSPFFCLSIALVISQDRAVAAERLNRLLQPLTL